MTLWLRTLFDVPCRDTDLTTSEMGQVSGMHGSRQTFTVLVPRHVAFLIRSWAPSFSGIPSEVALG